MKVIRFDCHVEEDGGGEIPLDTLFRVQPDLEELYAEVRAGTRPLQAFLGAVHHWLDFHPFDDLICALGEKTTDVSFAHLTLEET